MAITPVAREARLDRVEQARHMWTVFNTLSRLLAAGIQLFCHFDGPQ